MSSSVPAISRVCLVHLLPSPTALAAAKYTSAPQTFNQHRGNQQRLLPQRPATASQSSHRRLFSVRDLDSCNPFPSEKLVGRYCQTIAPKCNEICTKYVMEEVIRVFHGDKLMKYAIWNEVLCRRTKSNRMPS